MQTALALFILGGLVCVSAQRFSVPFPSNLEAGPLNGRLILILSTDPSDEPRFQVGTEWKDSSGNIAFQVRLRGTHGFKISRLAFRIPSRRSASTSKTGSAARFS